MIRMENDPNLESVTFDWVWRLDSIYTPDTKSRPPAQNPSASHFFSGPRMAVPQILTRLSTRLSRSAPLSFASVNLPLGPFKGRTALLSTFFAKLKVPDN